MKNLAGYFAVLALATWIVFALACAAHAYYHFKAANRLDDYRPLPPVFPRPSPPAPPGPQRWPDPNEPWADPPPGVAPAPEQRGGWKLR